jgi:hypothetical protein
MADPVNLPGWAGARMSYHTGSAYAPIACITSRSESNTSNIKEKVNVCTEGEVKKIVTRIDRSVSISGEVVDSGSLDALRALQDAKVETHFKVYRAVADTTPYYFTGIITALNAEYSAGDNEDSTFTMDIDINGGYSTSDPSVGD